MRWLAACAALVASLVCVALAPAAPRPPTVWDGVNPFACTLQMAGLGATVPAPAADPFCIDFDKTRQNVTQLGVVDFLVHEPARVAAAVPRCFYFQSDHWRGSVVQDDARTKTYEWDGHYYIDRARGDGGAWVTNLNVNGHTLDPSTIPGLPQDIARHLGPGTGGVTTHNEIPVEPRCAERARREGGAMYARPASGSGAPAAACTEHGGPVTRRRIGPVVLGEAEDAVRTQLGEPAEVRRGFLRYCTTGGGELLVGLPGDRSGTLGSDPDADVEVLVSTARAHRIHAVGAGTGERALRRAYRHSRVRMRMGRTRVYETSPGAPLLAGVRDRRVTFLAVYDRSAVRSDARLRSYLRRAMSG